MIYFIPKRECLNRLILISDKQLRYVIREYLEFYNHERPHAGLGRRTIKPRPQDADGEIVCTERLGCLFKYYHRVRRASMMDLCYTAIRAVPRPKRSG